MPADNKINKIKNVSVNKIKNVDISSFRKIYFPNATISEWNDWRWQINNCIRTAKDLKTIIRLTDDEREALSYSYNNEDNKEPRPDKGSLPLKITPYYASLLDEKNPYQPIRRSVVPVTAEYLRIPGENDDPLREDAYSPVSCIVHRYPDRVLFLVTNCCSTHCRYCTRSRMIKKSTNALSSIENWEEAITYIEKTQTVRDVLLSGGDPLILPDEKLDWLLSRLRRIPHIEILRIGTKVPIVLPQRITPSLTRTLKRHHPLFISIHVILPDELTPEANQACNLLADAGIPLGSQTVLLAGINDKLETIKRLVHALLKIRVKPYYLFQCDPISGSSHFRTPIEKGIDIIKGLRGYTSGYAVPTYAIDIPGSGGKVPLYPNYFIGKEGNCFLLKNYEGDIYLYPAHDHFYIS